MISRSTNAEQIHSDTGMIRCCAGAMDACRHSVAGVVHKFRQDKLVSVQLDLRPCGQGQRHCRMISFVARFRHNHTRCLLTISSHNVVDDMSQNLHTQHTIITHGIQSNRDCVDPVPSLSTVASSCAVFHFRRWLSENTSRLASEVPRGRCSWHLPARRCFDQCPEVRLIARRIVCAPLDCK